MTAMREQLEKLKHLFDDGLINEEEYRTQKQALLSSASAVSNPIGRGHPQATVVEHLEVGMEVGPEDKRYRLERFLGQGGMGAVWLALDLEATTRKGQNVHLALKFLPSDVVGNPRDEARLAEEAEKARQLGHPNIVRVWGWQRDPLTRLPFLEMEYLEGEDLYTVLHREGHHGLPLERALQLLNPVAEALKYAWEHHQLVHRDIKPGNILVTKDGKVKLLDFGISAQARRTASSVGPSNRTPGYHAPEAAGRHSVSPQLDAYSLGAVLYELLEGEVPFTDQRSPHTPWPEKPAALNDRQWDGLKQALAFDGKERLGSAWGLVQGIRNSVVVCSGKRTAPTPDTKTSHEIPSIALTEGHEITREVSRLPKNNAIQTPITDHTKNDSHYVNNMAMRLDLTRNIKPQTQNASGTPDGIGNESVWGNIVSIFKVDPCVNNAYRLFIASNLLLFLVYVYFFAWRPYGKLKSDMGTFGPSDVIVSVFLSIVVTFGNGLMAYAIKSKIIDDIFNGGRDSSYSWVLASVIILCWILFLFSKM